MKKNDDLKPFGYYLESIRSRDLYKVFDDFLTICVCCLSNQQEEEEYLKTIKKYTPDDVNLIAQAFASMVVEADNKGEGFHDPFGDYYMEHFSNKQRSQVFTPESLCDVMAEICSLNVSGNEINDPCCGSGRTLLAVAKRDPKHSKYYVAADISLICCKMTLVNMCLNSMRGEVYCMDTLSLETWRKWVIVVDKVIKMPFIFEVKKDYKEEVLQPADYEILEEKPERRKIEPIKAPKTNNIEYVFYQ